MTLTNLKICGVTSHDTARFCADLGVGALGVVFYARSPRHVSPVQALAILDGLPASVARVGVFADPASVDAVLDVARAAKLDTLQLHGAESDETLEALRRAGYRVIRAIKTAGQDLPARAAALPEDVGLLLECGRGALPGGNGAIWDWSQAAPLAAIRPFALAGGLAPDNILDAIRRSRATAWDISSGIEHRPGVKNHAAIRRLTEILASQAVAPLPLNATMTGFWSRVSPARVDLHPALP